jgi:protein-tyrosine-phosphatase
MAASIFNSRKPDSTDGEELAAQSRGLVVLFPEPYNPKMVSVLKENGIAIWGEEAEQLEESDFSEDTLILTMTGEQKRRVLSDYEEAQNVYTIGEFVGEEEDIPDPYGGTLDDYAQAFINMSYFINRVIEILYHTEES